MRAERAPAVRDPAWAAVGVTLREAHGVTAAVLRRRRPQFREAPVCVVMSRARLGFVFALPY